LSRRFFTLAIDRDPQCSPKIKGDDAGVGARWHHVEKRRGTDLTIEEEEGC
jgi:hypothetical protein